MRFKQAISGLTAVFLGLSSPFAFAESEHEREHLGALHEYNHIVVIYQENHSFDNLYGLWGKVGRDRVNGLPYADAAHTIQKRVDGSAYNCLLQNDPNFKSPPLSVTCNDTNPVIASHFANAPFSIDSVIANTVNTEDLVHRYYNEQFQIHGGMQDRYVLGSDAIGLSMGYYETKNLPIYQYLHGAQAPNYVIADNFFQAAFGGSFLNHQWLIAAATPIFANPAINGSADDLHSAVDANGMPTTTTLYSSIAGLRDKSLTAYCAGDSRAPAAWPITPAGVVCGDWAVNTTQPITQPYFPGTVDARRLPLQTGVTIGDRLTAKGVDWAWYSGGWSNAAGNVNAPGWTNTGGACSDPNTIGGAVYPYCANKLFQFHHQPFNYFANYATGAARADHLRDEVEFIAAAKAGRLKPVSFVKPIGADNEHPGYTSEGNGSMHLVDLVKAIVEGPNGHDTLIVITYDEFGGQWDHVSPPGQGRRGVHDVWGPGTRIPAMVISKKFHRSGVDHVDHDTTSILTTIEHRFGLAPLGDRDAAVRSLATAIKAVDD